MTGNHEQQGHRMTGTDTPTLSSRLETLAQSVPASGMSLGLLVKQLGHESLLLMCIVLCLPFLLPVSIPGVSTVFGLVIFCVGLAHLRQAAVWLPARVAGYVITQARLQDILKMGSRWVQRLERWLKPRLPQFTTAGAQRINGAMLLISAALLMLPLSLIPFSNTLPGLACMLLAAGLLSKDGYCIVLGYLLVLSTAVYFGLLAFAGTALLSRFFGA
jgi:hypothetical protein